MGIRSTKILLSLLIGFSFGITPPTEALAAQDLTPSNGDGDYFLFPYRCCVLLTVKDAHVEVGQSTWCADGRRTTLTVYIDEVLKGALKQGQTLDVTFNGPTENLFGGKTVADVIGKRLVLAFDGSRFPDGVLGSWRLPFEIRGEIKLGHYLGLRIGGAILAFRIRLLRR